MDPTKFTKHKDFTKLVSDEIFKSIFECHRIINQEHLIVQSLFLQISVSSITQYSCVYVV